MTNFPSFDRIYFMETEVVQTEKTVFGGNTIAKINSKTVFIPYALPDETLSVNIVQHKNDYDNAQIIKIIKASPYRKQPECEYYGLCGGCNMMHIQSDYQCELRKQMLIDSFNTSKLEFPDDIQVIRGPDFNYRARFQLTDGGLCLKNDTKIVKIKKCLCAEEPVNEYLINTSDEKRPAGRVHLFGSSRCEQGLKINLEENKTVNKTRLIGKTSKKLKLKENHHFSGTMPSPENILTVKLLDKQITFDVRGFFQSNLFVFEKVLALIKDLLPGGENILDMYSGCGSISCFLADKYKNVILVEHNRDALVFAEQNMQGKTHQSYGMSGQAWVKNCASYNPAFDACVVDPPRSGMEKEVLEYFCNSDIPFIIYLSCNPSTQSRDCKTLCKAGYKITKLYLLDFYPNTSHIESLAVLEKIK